MIRSILVAVDDSVRAPVVFGTAADLAQRLGATLHLFRAVALPPEFPAAAHVEGIDALPRVLREKAVADLTVLARDYPQTKIEAPLVGPGQPWRIILDAADRLNVDLIVIGSHGYHGLDRVLGTTSGKVADHAKRNVFIVHNGAHT